MDERRRAAGSGRRRPTSSVLSRTSQLLGTARVATDSRPTRFAIPPDLAARAPRLRRPVELRLVTPTWNPHAVLGTPDDRELGVMVDRVAVR